MSVAEASAPRIHVMPVLLMYITKVAPEARPMIRALAYGPRVAAYPAVPATDIYEAAIGLAKILAENLLQRGYTALERAADGTEKERDLLVRLDRAIALAVDNFARMGVS